MESVRCPTIALVQGACFGAGVDLITACDIRFATADAKLCVKVRLDGDVECTVCSWLPCGSDRPAVL